VGYSLPPPSSPSLSLSLSLSCYSSLWLHFFFQVETFRASRKGRNGIRAGNARESFYPWIRDRLRGVEFDVSVSGHRFTGYSSEMTLGVNIRRPVPRPRIISSRYRSRGNRVRRQTAWRCLSRDTVVCRKIRIEPGLLPTRCRSENTRAHTHTHTDIYIFSFARARRPRRAEIHFPGTHAAIA